MKLDAHRVFGEVGRGGWSLRLDAQRVLISELLDGVHACSLLLLLLPPMTNAWPVRKDSSPAHASIVAHVVAVHHTPIVVALDILPLFLFGIFEN